ncbi:MAG: efflux RND transporter periplasmic adaptor subunit [Bacteroidetes bacterium]|nr:efflux RND transporter periplasmic adaptor subunit [Bacteroidota bacterium]
MARFQITNVESEIKPGMLVNINIQSSKIKALSLPVDAIIQNSIGTNVWVRNRDSVFENKMVVTGIQNSSQVEIKSGLFEGDVVVISGAYLLNSEYVFKKGASPMAGHGHKNSEEPKTQSMQGMKM